MKDYDLVRIREMIDAVRQTNMNYISYETDEVEVVVSVLDASEGEVLVKIQFND